ncbi:hypothetical protein GCM10011418_18760 [Sphingobacterium alkalisoli]|uniref:hypothetical protein n=1 Tax=Sphingobacterium alkalisoli TaxID=1874115 RepID=UPI0019A63946|nr:hypothetical protein [Sphingobacterium alkalisoli]GGH16416.1 hypothetical protein GCM10011418_18760 [Sphingobacterium alkalisoli]
MMGRSGRKIGQDYQFWQQHNKPIELWSVDVIDQKVDYIPNNPVDQVVSKPHYWKYSSAIDYSGGKGFLNWQNFRSGKYWHRLQTRPSKEKSSST